MSPLKPDLTFAAVWQGGATAYPITYQSWDLVNAKQPTANDAAMLKAYLGYLLGDGQKLLEPDRPRAAACQPRPAGNSAAGQDHVVSGEFCDASGSDRLVVMSTAAQAGPAAPAGSANPLAHRRPLGDRIFQILAAAAGVLVLVILALIAISTSQQASSWFSTEGWSIFTVDWNPATNSFGAMAFVYGTVITATIAIILSVPVSVGVALLLTEVVPRRWVAADRVRDRPAGRGSVGGLGPVGDPGVRPVAAADLHLDRFGRERHPGARRPVRAAGERGLVLHLWPHPGLHDHADRDLAVA